MSNDHALYTHRYRYLLRDTVISVVKYMHISSIMDFDPLFVGWLFGGCAGAPHIHTHTNTNTNAHAHAHTHIS
jgi:hypothetical protein